MRVLIVEDESPVSLLLQEMLREMGHSVSGIAPSLRTALAIAAGVPSDLAIVDIGLAGDGGDGVDAALALRQKFGVPTLLMSGASLAQLDERAAAAQPVGFLKKPYTYADVENAVISALERVRQAP
ncbi:MAG: response regulator [Steroidobacter sp.]